MLRQADGRIVVSFTFASRLRDEQARVVQEVLTQKVTVVSAGAGTGKTFTTIAAVLALLQNAAEPPISLDQFVLITFSRKAATELRLRMAAALRGELEAARNANDMARVKQWRHASERLGSAYIGTFHAFCRRLLRTYGYSEYVARESDVSFSLRLQRQAFTQTRSKILDDTPDSCFVRAQLFTGEHQLTDYGLQELVLDIIQHVRNRNLSLDKIVELTEQRSSTDTNRGFSLAVAYATQWTLEFFDQIRRSEQQLDSYDLLYRTAKLLENAQVRQRVAQRYRYLFIDEFQDTDALQKDLVELLAERFEKLVVVGDKKQSIYYFRGARHDFLEDIAHLFNVPTLPLRISGRARPEVITVQNQLFKSMASGDKGWSDLDEPLHPDPRRQRRATSNGLPPLCYINASHDRGDQDARVAAAIREVQRLVKRGFALGDIALLFRGNVSMLRYLDALRRTGIPARSSQGESFYAQPEIVIVYRILRCILQADDDAALALALQTPVMRAARDVNMEKRLLQQGSTRERLTTWFANQFAPSTQHAMHEKLRTLRRELLEDTVPGFLGRLYRDLSFVEAFHGSTVVARNLDRLREIARDLVEVEEAITVEMFTDVLQIRIEQEAREEGIDPPPLQNDPKPPYVQLMTVHAAKGLEFPVVIIPEVQADLMRGNENQQPDYVVQSALGATDIFGLDINPRLAGSQQARDKFYQRVKLGQRDRLEEEMRLLYVALTRTKEIAILIGTGAGQLNRREDSRYSWQDEVLQARNMLKAVGAQFR
jgi:DNA helicase-2/ATP-dependent DNA helicase PcrA